jgi:hypothetical protein
MMELRRAFVAGCALWLSTSAVAFAQGVASPPAPPPDQQPPAGYPSDQPPPGYPQPEYPQQQYPQQQYPQEQYPQQQYPQQQYPQQQYPQQQYPQEQYPQEQYPQQQYPQEQYPQEQYPQQQYPQQQYPQQPQPGYPPPPYPPRQPVRSPFLAMFYLGANVFTGNLGENVFAEQVQVDPGLRLGTILGLRVNQQFSLNGELTLDAVNLRNAPLDVAAGVADLALSPLFHVVSGNLEAVIGPKLGLWGLKITNNNGITGASDQLTASGWLAGINAGAFASIAGTTSIGGLLSVEARRYTQVCDRPAGSVETCGTNGATSTDKVFGVNGAVMF